MGKILGSLAAFWACTPLVCGWFAWRNGDIDSCYCQIRMHRLLQEAEHAEKAGELDKAAAAYKEAAGSVPRKRSRSRSPYGLSGRTSKCPGRRASTR